MTVAELKEYIYENNKIEYILNEIKCGNIKYHENKEYYTCSNHNGDNPTAVNIKNNQYLNVTNYTRKKEFGDKSDLITLVQYNKGLDFKSSIKYLHEILGLKYTYKPYKKNDKKKKDDPLHIFKRFKKKKTDFDVSDIKTLNDNVLEDYVPVLHISWFKEGVMPWTRERFQLGYSYRQSRVIIPLRYWQTGELLGTNARTTIENYKELGILKFFTTPTYPKNINLYGLWENYNAIKKMGYVVVYEAEKSVLKRHSLGDGTGVALSGHTMSDEQVRILIGLDVEIIIALDNDICIEEIRHMCSKFYQIRKVSYIKDKNGMLDKYDSPADVSGGSFSKLMNNRIIYDSLEHEKYLESLRRNEY